MRRAKSVSGAEMHIAMLAAAKGCLDIHTHFASLGRHTTVWACTRQRASVVHRFGQAHDRLGMHTANSIRSAQMHVTRVAAAKGCLDIHTAFAGLGRHATVWACTLQRASVVHRCTLPRWLLLKAAWNTRCWTYAFPLPAWAGTRPPGHAHGKERQWCTDSGRHTTTWAYTRQRASVVHRCICVL